MCIYLRVNPTELSGTYYAVREWVLTSVLLQQEHLHSFMSQAPDFTHSQLIFPSQPNVP